MVQHKLPPNQQLAAPGKWPLVGEREADPARRGAPWVVGVEGLVKKPTTWSLDELRAFAQVEQTVDIHCVTRWSRPGARFAGVPLRALLDVCQPLPEARYLSFVARSARGHSTSLSLADALELGVLVALRFEGQPLAPEHGGPVRTVVPGRYFYKSLKWLERVELLADDRLGFWEQEAGYHNQADPWREQRYIVPELDANEARRLLQKRDFSGRNLLGLRAEGRALAGLDARGAQLRNAHFEGTTLKRARFDGANLSNAHFTGANLKGASLAGADCEGADFCDADLRGADLSGASLFGASFVAGDGSRGARLDAATTISPEALEQLTPSQRAYVAACLQGSNP